MSDAKFARISITLPPEVLATADRLAAQDGRSRSWLIAEAIRRLGGADPAQLPVLSPIREPAVADQVLGFRTHQEYAGWRARRREIGRVPADNWLVRICGHLAGAGARHVVIGSQALRLWGVPNLGTEIALLVDPSPENGRAVCRALREAGLLVAREWLGDELAHRAALVIGQAPRVDLLTGLPSLDHARAAGAARTLEVEGVPVRVLSVDQLLEAMERDQDADPGAVSRLQAIRRQRRSR